MKPDPAIVVNLLIGLVEQRTGVLPGTVRHPSRAEYTFWPRALVCHLATQCVGLYSRQVAPYIERERSSVSHAAVRVRERVSWDAGFRRLVALLERDSKPLTEVKL